jgi:hypothetical protein
MSQKHLPRRVDYRPSSETPSQPAASDSVLITSETGRVIDSEREPAEHPKTTRETPQDRGD